MHSQTIEAGIASEVGIPTGSVTLTGELMVPAGARGVVLFAHGSGSSRHSPPSQFVARIIRNAGFGTLIFDLLTLREEEDERWTRHLRFNIELLSQRLMGATRWIKSDQRTAKLPCGYFGLSTGAAAALVAAARLGKQIGAVVSRGGRPDLAEGSLSEVRSPTLLIVGELDTQVIGLHSAPFNKLHCEKQMAIVPGATHLFEEPETLEQVASLAVDWFQRHLIGSANARAGSNGRES
jgi:putative phosphoribosyl transferase